MIERRIIGIPSYTRWNDDRFDRILEYKHVRQHWSSTCPGHVGHQLMTPQGVHYGFEMFEKWQKRPNIGWRLYWRTHQTGNIAVS